MLRALAQSSLRRVQSLVFAVRMHKCCRSCAEGRAAETGGASAATAAVWAWCKQLWAASCPGAPGHGPPSQPTKVSAPFAPALWYRKVPSVIYAKKLLPLCLQNVPLGNFAKARVCLVGLVDTRLCRLHNAGSRWQASPGHPLSRAHQPASSLSSPPTPSSSSSSREAGERMRTAWWCAAHATPSWSAWAEEAPPRWGPPHFS